MDALDEMKTKWSQKCVHGKSYRTSNLPDAIRQRMRLHTRESMKYFWASFTLQIIVYALYSHALLRYMHDPMTVTLSVLGIVAYIPFTHILMRKFKQLALTKPGSAEVSSVQHYIEQKRNILQSFFTFKRRYEFFLIPVSSLFGTLLVFKIYVPGGPLDNLNGVWITMVITLISCYIAIRRENLKSFRAPLTELDKLITEFKEDR
ncbi:hypothetical protein WBG78_02775 [Chryseolinea sp. T2]|uniref:hypothetical protein n=1 Tax=Chryseolinea sp. T2 TaxID=3129255 RepID=UPI003077C0A6